MFRKFDIDKDDALTQFEFSLAAQALGRDMVPIQVQLAFQLCDTDKNGAISVEEFCTWWLAEVRAPVEQRTVSRSWFARKPGQMDVVQERELAMRAFSQFDTDGNGSLDANEFKLLTRLTGSNLSDADVAALMRQIDTDNNNVITFDEFYIWLTTHTDERHTVLHQVRRNVDNFARKKWLDKVSEIIIFLFFFCFFFV